MNPNVNYSLHLIVIYEDSFINSNKCTNKITMIEGTMPQVKGARQVLCALLAQRAAKLKQP